MCHLAIFFNMGKQIITTAMIAVLLSSCSLTHRLNKDAHTADLSLPKPMVDAPVKDTSSYVSNITELRDTSNQFLLDAQTDSDGDKIALIDIESISVITTTKTVAERMGEISIDFMISIPISLQNKNWAVSFTPVLNMGNDISDLDKIIIRGEIFNDLQKRQYWQFNKYLNRITGSEAFAINSNALIAQYYEARKLLPERKRASIEKVYRETIKYPYANDSRLDSVLLQKGQLNYYYTQVIKTNERAT